jgi:hypothetical protein
MDNVEKKKKGLKKIIDLVDRAVKAKKEKEEDTLDEDAHPISVQMRGER